MKTNIIEFIIKNRGLRQKDIAESLGVSKAQISKWKAGESIPHDREKELNQLAGLFGHDSEWALLVKNEANADSWFEYFSFINDSVDCGPCWTLNESPEVYVPGILLALNKVGFRIPEKSPSVECLEEDNLLDEDTQEIHSFLYELIDYYAAYITWSSRFLQFDDLDLFEISNEIEAYAIDLALGYISDETIAKFNVDINSFRSHLSKNKRKVIFEIGKLCIALNQAGITITVDYFDYVNQSPYYLDDVSSGVICSDNKIEEFISYGQKLILQESRETNKLLTELHVKIDTLLSESDKEKLSKVLELCKPLENKHLKIVYDKDT